MAAKSMGLLEVDTPSIAIVLGSEGYSMVSSLQPGTGNSAILFEPMEARPQINRSEKPLNPEGTGQVMLRFTNIPAVEIMRDALNHLIEIMKAHQKHTKTRMTKSSQDN